MRAQAQRTRVVRWWTERARRGRVYVVVSATFYLDRAVRRGRDMSLSDRERAEGFRGSGWVLLVIAVLLL